jgi:hypothetical protein
MSCAKPKLRGSLVAVLAKHAGFDMAKPAGFDGSHALAERRHGIFAVGEGKEL